MDFDTALTFLADDCEYTNIPMGTVRGHAGVREVLGPFFAPIRENEFLILRKAADGPIVFLERLDRHRLDHGWRELPGQQRVRGARRADHGVAGLLRPRNRRQDPRPVCSVINLRTHWRTRCPR